MPDLSGLANMLNAPIVRHEAPTERVDIFIGGDIETARAALREYCMKGLCVSLAPADFIFTGGMESGVRVGLINYPRFPKPAGAVYVEAVALAEFLIERLHQSSCCVVGEHHTAWLTRRGG